MDLSKLTPSDGIVALRSFERRYRGLFAGLGEGESPDDLAQRRGPDGWSALEHMVAAARAIAASGRALERVLTSDAAVVDRTEIEPATRERPGAPSGTVHERLAELGLEAGRLADEAAKVPARDWARTAMVDGGTGRQITTLDLLRAAVDAGVTHLRAAEQTLRQVRA